MKSGYLFRCGELGHATEADVKGLQSLGLKVIFDYRDEFEVVQNVSPALLNVENIRIPAKVQKSVIQTGNIEELLKSDIMLNPDILGEFYAEMVFNNPSYRELIKNIYLKQTPLLHHCTAGKDRTGVGAALIYLLLGVTEEQIITDYLRTNDEMRANPPKWFTEMQETMKDRADVFKALSGVKESYIRKVFAAIQARYDNYETYFVEEFGLTLQMQQEIKDYYLE